MQLKLLKSDFTGRTTVNAVEQVRSGYVAQAPELILHKTTEEKSHAIQQKLCGHPRLLVMQAVCANKPLRAHHT